MKKRIIFPLLSALLLSLAACYRPAFDSASAFYSESTMVEDRESEAVSNTAPAAASLSPSLERLMETVDALCVEPRPVGSDAEYRAALYLRGRLEEYGYATDMEIFSYSITDTTLSERYRQARQLTGEAFLAAGLAGDKIDGYSRNVIGRQPREGEAKKILVLSAHYDSTPDSIGVVDNAAGVAVVLEAAGILADVELPFSLRIVFFGGEEEILLGSRQYLMGLEPGDAARIFGNITVDTLAYADTESFSVLTPLTLSEKSAAALAAASPVAAAFLKDPRVMPEYGSQLVGDHMSFYAGGIDSVNFGQSMDAVMEIINSPRDTYDILAPALLPTATELLVEAVRKLAAET